MSTAKSFISEIRTIHESEVQYWWTDKTLHDADYQFKVDHLINQKVKELTKKYDVVDDTKYCCQWDGRQLYSTDLQQLTQAIQELAVYLTKFKGIEPI